MRQVELVKATQRRMRREEPVRDARVVLEESRRVPAAIPSRAPEAAIGPDERSAHEGDQPVRGIEEVRPAERRPSLRQRAKDEPVPGGELLVVARGMDPSLAGCEQRPSSALEQVATGGRARRGQDRAPLPVPRIGDTPVLGEGVHGHVIETRAAQDGAQLGSRPRVVPSLLALQSASRADAKPPSETSSSRTQNSSVDSTTSR